MLVSSWCCTIVLPAPQPCHVSSACLPDPEQASSFVYSVFVLVFLCPSGPPIEILLNCLDRLSKTYGTLGFFQT